MDFQKFQAMLADKNIRYVFANYVNLAGHCMGRMLSTQEMFRLTDGSLLFAGVPSDGLNQYPNEKEVAAIADIESFSAMPWKAELGWVACCLKKNGSDYPYCSRVVLKRICEELFQSTGLRARIGFEYELYLLRRASNGVYLPFFEDEPPIPAYNLPGTLALFTYANKIRDYMIELGWNSAAFIHEGGRSQLEFTSEPTDPVVAADKCTFFKTMAKAVAHDLGAIATFMPKPFANDLGTGMHINITLTTEDGKNVFENPKGINCLSQIANEFVAGILAHARSITAITCPTINSYKRLYATPNTEGVTWTPQFVTYGPDNRTAMLRVVTSGPRIELRTVDASCNPYLATAVIIAAGLDGIRRHLSLGPGRTDNLYEWMPGSESDKSLFRLPRTLLEALDAFNEDNLMKDTLGRPLVKAFMHIKNREWQDYNEQITQWEIERYINA